MVRGGAVIWPLRIGLTACCALLPWLAGPWYALVMLLALPILRALLDASHERLTAWLCVAGGCISAALLLPRWLWPAVAVWGLGLLTMSFLRVAPGKATIRSGAMLAAVTGISVLALSSLHFEGQMISALAQEAIDAIDRHPNSAAMLLSAYQAGLARLEGDLALVPALRLFNIVIMPQAVRMQLLYSLRFTIETVLQAYLPRWLVGWMLLTALVPALAVEGCLYGRGKHSDLPAPSRWYLPGRLAAGMMVMLLLSFLPYLTQSPALGYLGAMCGTLGYWAWAAQGASTLAYLLTGHGFRPLTCGLLIALGVTVLPLVLFLLGCYDQLCDPRLLRGSRSETI
ncbi:MAG: hypothetical protein J1E43_11140 [Christensenellaceae bacterium]|nr:hypothetical protein [Christensenellaceae bacterium]